LRNGDVARVLRQLGYYTELEDSPNSQFKARAYYKASDTIANLSTDILSVYHERGIDGLLEIPTVGKAIAGKIEEFLKAGKVEQLDKLKSRLPINVDEFYALEGIGPKTVRALYDSLGIKNLDELEKAALSGRIRAVQGFSEKKEKDIIKRISFFRTGRGRRILGEIYPLAKQIESRLKKTPGVTDAIAAGSLRRMKETIGDIDFLACAQDADPVIESFVTGPQVHEVLAKGSSKAFVRLSGGIDADLLVVPRESWGSALQYFTGSKEHSVETRRIAISKGLRLNEWGVYRGTDKIAGETEEGVYAALGMAWIPPEMRENAGEIELAIANKIPNLVDYDSLRGDLQVHSDSTDGTASIEEMARGAREFGLSYIAITDHTKSLTIAGGLNEEELLDQANKIWEMADKVDGIRILAAAEVNIMKDGSLDIPNNVLDKLDVVGAAIHSNFALPEEDQTARLLSAAENPSVDILFHPTGRLINKREGYQIEVSKVMSSAVDTGTVLEIDAHYDRLDLREEHIRLAVKQGAKLVIDSDAHHPVHYAYLNFGIAQARRGWAGKSNILNTLPVEDLLNSLK
jgi:DNA polymerase (family X)